MSNTADLDAVSEIEPSLTVEFDDVSEYIAVLEATELAKSDPSDVIAEIVSQSIREYKLTLEQRRAQSEQQREVARMAQAIPDDVEPEDLEDALSDI